MKLSFFRALLLLGLLASCGSPETPAPLPTSGPAPAATPPPSPPAPASSTPQPVLTADRPTSPAQTATAWIPTAEPVWSEGYYFPRFPRPRQVYAIRAESGLEDWWENPRRPYWRVNQSRDLMAALTLVSMQGIINRADPAVYLDWQDRGMQRDAAHFWLEPLAEAVDVIPVNAEGMDAVEFLWQRFSARFHGAVIYDPTLPDTINLATMLAGLEDRLMLAPDQLELPGIKAILDELDGTCAPAFNPLNLPALAGHRCVTDLRSLAEQEGWSEPPGDWDLLSQSRTRIYQWVYDNLWPRLEKRGIGMISPGPASSRSLYDPQTYDPPGLACRDYIIALRLPALWLSPVDEPDATLLSQFLMDSPSPIPLYSFYDQEEVGTVGMASRHGDWVAVIPNSNTPLSSGNLTVLAGIDEPVQRFQARLDDDRLFAALGDRPIVTLWSTDGDSIQYLMDRGFHGGPDFYWDGVRGSAFGWTTNPTLASLSPLVWNYYVGTARGTSFVLGLSGAGLTHPALMSDTQLDRYLDYTARYMDLTGTRTLFVDDVTGPFDARLATQYYTHLQPAGYLGAFATGGASPGGQTYSYAGAPAPLVHAAYVLRPGTGPAILQELLSLDPSLITLDFPALPSAGSPIADGTAVDGEAVRFRRPDLPNCCGVIATDRMTLAPGSNTATFRLRVDDNGSQLPFVHLLVLQQVGAGRILVDRTLSPSEFAQSGEWQEFTLSLTLDEFVPDVQIFVDYLGGMPGSPDADLYADTITLHREGGPALPTALAIMIGLVGPTEPLNEDLRLVTEELEKNGGLLLTPDEFMAALNPEYMIGFATPLLGADHPSLVEARALLEKGKFFESLLTVRQALKGIANR